LKNIGCLIYHFQLKIIIIDKIEKLRKKYNNDYFNKYFKQTYFNNITSHEDVKTVLLSTNNKNSNAFKINIAFGYITEIKVNETVSVFEPTQQYYFKEPRLVRNKPDMSNIIRHLNEVNILEQLALQFPDSATRVIGIYAMAIKTFDMGYPIGAQLNLPDYIVKSKNIIALDKVENNMCFWACVALMMGCRRDRYITKAKELFIKFYGKYNNNYLGFDFVNELGRFENTFEFAINIVQYEADNSIIYIKKI
jgi:hypothetical protein